MHGVTLRDDLRAHPNTTYSFVTVTGEERERERERERENFIEINRKHDDTCTNKNEELCGLIQGDLR